jgi:2-methylisocitrate lyase-like PEP mutase family enzyme
LDDGSNSAQVAGAALRRILAGSECVMAVSAHDPLLAKLVEQAGFPMIGLSGNAVAASYLGMPDMGFLNLSDTVNVARRIAAAVSIPVLVDCDTGYGNAMGVQRTVREFEQAGVAGIIIEDQIDYKKCGMIKTAHPVVPAEEHAAKIRSACLARTDPDFAIVARTDARQITDWTKRSGAASSTPRPARMHSMSRWLVRRMRSRKSGGRSCPCRSRPTWTKARSSG